jgi:uncharacterized protein (TIGR02757 family)
MNSAERSLAEIAEEAYRRFHSARYIAPDPLELVYRITDPAEREVAAFIAASFALGRVQSILTAVRSIFDRLERAAGSVRNALLVLSFEDLRTLFQGFGYRFFGTDEVAAFLSAIGTTIRECGSLEAQFRSGVSGRDTSSLAPLVSFSRELRARLPADCGILLTDPEKGASKRMHLFLRWMVRSDEVDPGGWRCISAERLIVPMDTHMLRISRFLCLTKRRSADLRTAMEVTEAFRAIRPDDPVRYDFSLTRYGIHPEGRRTDPAGPPGPGRTEGFPPYGDSIPPPQGVTR